MNNPIRVGIIGASGKSWAVTTHLPALRALPDFEVSAVATTKEESARATAAAFGVPRWFGDPAELVSCPDVDLVAICVKVPQHDALIRAAIAAGKHVYCEWPLALDEREAHELADLAARSGRTHVVGLQGVCSPSVRYVRDLVAGGHIGDVLSASFQVSLSGFGDPTIARSRLHITDAAGGATLMTVGAGHALSVLATILGPFRELSAIVATRQPTAVVVETGEKVQVTAPDQVLITGSLRDGTSTALTVLGGVAPAASGFSMRIVGSDATLLIEPAVAGLPCQIAEWSIHLAKGDSTQPLPLPGDQRPPAAGLPTGPAGSVAHAYAEFAAALRDGREAAPGFGLASAVHRVLAAASRASTTGRQEDLDGT